MNHKWYTLRSFLVLVGGFVLILLSVAPAANTMDATHHWIWSWLNANNAKARGMQPDRIVEAIELFNGVNARQMVYPNYLEGYAWGTNVGWIHLNPPHGGVAVYPDHVEGYAWGENIGWIRLGTCTGGSPCAHANTTASNYGVNHDGTGNLSGYAWGTNIGWIHFNPPHGGVRVDPVTGHLSGYAWGENIGWIRFQNSDPANSRTIVVQAEPAAGGIVTGGGRVEAGHAVTVTATANTGYAFIHWSEGGTPVATTPSYHFVATADRSLVATFAKAPLAVNDAAGTLQGDAVVIDPLANDLDRWLAGLTLTSALQPLHGSVVLNDDASTVTYIPLPDFVGLDTFQYAIQDAIGVTSTASVAVVVKPRSNFALPQVALIDGTRPNTVTFHTATSEIALELPLGSYNGVAGPLAETDIFYVTFTEITTPTAEALTPPGEMNFAGRMFTLEAFFNQTRLAHYQFQEPVTLTLRYAPGQEHNWLPETIELFYWNESLRQWLQDGLTDLGHDTVNHTITYQIAHLTQFSYFGRRRPTALEPGAEPVLAAAYVYLPVVARGDLTTIGTPEEAFQEKE